MTKRDNTMKQNIKQMLPVTMDTKKEHITIMLGAEELRYYELQTPEGMQRCAFRPLPTVLESPQRIGEQLSEQVIGDLTARSLQPDSVACDLYPKFPTSYAAERLSEHYSVPVQRLQSCYRALRSALEKDEHKRAAAAKGARVLGVYLGAPSFGSDGTLWGGEVLELTAEGFMRRASIHPYQLIGTNMELRKSDPWKTAVSMLYDLARMQHTEDEAIRDFVAKQAASEQIHQLGLCGLNEARAQYIAQDRHKSTTRSSAAEGLFDAAAAILKLCGGDVRTGETPMEALASAAAGLEMTKAQEAELQALLKRLSDYTAQAEEAEDPTLESDDLWEDTDESAFLEEANASPDILHTEQLIRILVEEQCRYSAAAGASGKKEEHGCRMQKLSDEQPKEHVRLLARFFMDGLHALIMSYLKSLLSEEEQASAVLLTAGAAFSSDAWRPGCSMTEP